MRSGKLRAGRRWGSLERGKMGARTPQPTGRCHREGRKQPGTGVSTPSECPKAGVRCQREAVGLCSGCALPSPALRTGLSCLLAP